MTVGMKDVVLLRDAFKRELFCIGQARPFADWDGVSAVLRSWHWSRKPLAATVNILSVALYDLFGASGTSLEGIRDKSFNVRDR
jgi:squalene monooxygenase